MTLIAQVVSLQDSIGGYAAKDLIPWQIANLTNTLVEQAKQVVPNNPTLEAIELFRKSDGSKAYSGDIGTVRAILSQLSAIVPASA